MLCSLLPCLVIVHFSGTGVAISYLGQY